MQKNYKAKYVILNSETILENFFIEITDNIITNLTTKSARIKRLQRVKSDAPPKPTT